MTTYLLRRPWSLTTVEWDNSPDLERLYPNRPAHLEASDIPLLVSESQLAFAGGRGIHAPEIRLARPNRSPLRVYRAPLPAQPGKGVVLRDGAGNSFRVKWRGVPDRPPGEIDEGDGEQRQAATILTAVRHMAARLDIVGEVARRTPRELWDQVADIWLGAQKTLADPTMDVIVGHARRLDRLLLDIVSHPRRILARTHRLTPLSRVQEMDRRALLWLSRQPGETLAERAGPGQRVLAPVRQEVIDTPENRVLRSLAEESLHIAREWRRQNRQQGPRRNDVEHYEKLCGRIAHTLEKAAVGRAVPGVRPSYVLQHDARYRRIWAAWQELLQRRRVLDDLWRWQSRTWEEFCLVALTIACVHIEGVEMVAASPLRFRSEQSSGSRLIHDAPFVVFWFRSQNRRRNLVIEIIARHDGDRTPFPSLGASAWLRLCDFDMRYQRWIPVWALHLLSTEEVHLSEEIEGMKRAVAPIARDQCIQGGIALRSQLDPDAPISYDVEGCTFLALDFGPGTNLVDGIEFLSDHLHRSMKEDDR